MANKSEAVVCPYCGTAQPPAERCKACGGWFDLYSLTATEIEMGPWFVRDEHKPHLPGCSYQVLRKRVEAGKIKPDTIIRGPTTRQLWVRARHAPCVAHLLGLCHNCSAEVKATDTKCHNCSAIFSESTERQELGLRFRTNYAAATARIELDKLIEQEQARRRAEAEQARKQKQVAKSDAQQRPDRQEQTPQQDAKAPARSGPAVDDLITDGWTWTRAPSQPIPGDATAPETDDDAPDEPIEPTVAPAGEDEIQGHRPPFATKTLIHQPPPGATHDAGATVFNVPGAAKPAPKAPEAPLPLLSPGAWTWLVVLGGLFIAMFWHFIQRMTMIALNDADWSHALIVPLISLYFIYQRYDRLKKTPPRVNFWGLPVIFIGLFSYAFWIEPGRNDMFQGYSLILTLLGLTLFVLGPGMLKYLWLPIVYLAFGVKVSDAIWNPLAAKLQLLAAQASTVVLQFFSSFMDLEATRRGTTISLSFMRDGAWVTGQELNVAEACSGLRMLAAFMALGVLVAYLAPRAWWQRLVMVVLTVPIALLVNIGRVAILGLLYPINPEMAAGSFHQYVGIVMLIPALLLYLLVGWILDRVYIYEPPPEPAAPVEAPKLPRARTPIQRFNDATRGVMCGAVLCLLVGATYGALLLTIRPDLAKGDFSQAMGMQMLLGSFAVLAVFAWFVRRVIGPEIRQPRIVGRTVSMGLIAGVLATSVLGLTAIVKATKVVMIKQPIELRQPLYQIPAEIGPWVRVQDDPVLSEEMIDALGTRSYISRIYRDTSADPEDPGDIVKLHVAYYTGTPDTVPHVPERCFVAGGMQAINEGATEITLQGNRYIPAGDGYRTRSQLEPHEVHLPEKRIDATVFTFASANDPSVQANVIYFFSANGKFLATPEGVRLKGFDPRDRYSYYCKIEVLVPDVSDATVATARTSAFLSDVLPEIVACLPKWDDVKGGGVSQ